MWEKELVQTQMQPYIIEQSRDYGTQMYLLAADRRNDDDQVTPR